MLCATRHERQSGLNCDDLAGAAVAALIAEAELTPKPALIDRRGNGAHDDLDLDRMRRSANALRGTFAEIVHCAARCGDDRILRVRIGAIGREGERRMLAATGGTNAHRGAIWSLGLIVAAAAMPGARRTAHAVAIRAARLARHSDTNAPNTRTNGSMVSRKYAVGGAREEAQRGFPHVLFRGLPALRASRKTVRCESCASLNCLLAIMSQLDDTCLLHRGGRKALSMAKRGASAVLQLGGAATCAGRTAFGKLEADLLSFNVSPGGSADLLAATLLLDWLDPRPQFENGSLQNTTGNVQNGKP